MLWLMLGAMLLGMGVLLCAIAVALMAWSMVHPPRMTDGKAAYLLHRLSPDDLSLDYQTTAFDVHDQSTGRSLRLVAWWIPTVTPSEGTVILIHGYGDAKVGAIAWAPPWHALGLNMLALDLRAHGESQGTTCTAGFYERDDLSQVIDQLRAQRPGQTRQLVLMGISLGAAVVAATAVGRSDIDCVVMDSPVGDFSSGATTLARSTDLPLPSLMPLAVRLAGWRLKADFSAVSAQKTIPHLTCPYLLIQSEQDNLVSPAMRKRLTDAAGPSNTWIVSSAGHTQALLTDTLGYVEHLSRLLDRSRSRV